MSDAAVGAGSCLGRELLSGDAELAGVLDRSGELLELPGCAFLAERGRVSRSLSGSACFAAVDVRLSEIFVAPNETRRAAARR